MPFAPEELVEEERRVRRLRLGEMVRRLVPLVRPQARLLLGGTLAMLVGIGAELAGPLALRHLIDAGLVGGSRHALYASAALLAFLFACSGLAAWVQVVLLAKMGLAIVTTLKRALFHHLLGLSMAYFDENSPGKLLARVESDTERLQALFSEVGVSLLRTLLLVLGMFVVMFATAWQIAAAVVALAVPVIFATVFFFRWMHVLYRRVRALYARISAFVSEFVQGVPVLRAFGYEVRAEARLAGLNQDKLVAERRAALLDYGFWGALSAVEVVAVILILWIAAGDTLGAAMTPGVFVLFLEYTRRAFRPLIAFSEQLGQVQRAFASADRVFEVLDTRSLTRDRPDARPKVPDDWKALRFEDVSFEYDGGTRALDGVSFTIGRGEKVALVGLSGGGKTTLTSLLLRFHDPTEGRIALDGDDIRAWRIAAWRSRLGLVLQDIHLFPGTVRENLCALAEDVPGEAVDRAVAVAGIQDLLGRLPGGYDEILHERGANLSMGERQLLCFARALAHDPDVLVLDEATSSVDPATERRLKDALDRLLRGRTALIVAHRLATVVGADRILVLHQGRLVEEGTHRELYVRGGVYRDLFDLQFREAGAAT